MNLDEHVAGVYFHASTLAAVLSKSTCIAKKGSRSKRKEAEDEEEDEEEGDKEGEPSKKKLGATKMDFTGRLREPCDHLFFFPPYIYSFFHVSLFSFFSTSLSLSLSFSFFQAVFVFSSLSTASLFEAESFGLASPLELKYTK